MYKISFIFIVYKTFLSLNLIVFLVLNNSNAFSKDFPSLFSKSSNLFIKDKNIKSFFNIIFPLLLATGYADASAQRHVVDSLLCRGDSLRMAYRFEDSAEAYSEAMKIASDSVLTNVDSVLVMLISDRIVLSENGKNMTGFVYNPVVVAKHKFSKEDFFLYYPLKDRSWRTVPNVLDTVSGPYAKALYAPAEADVIYFSAPDSEGIRNIYRTEKGDSLWSLPSLINEQMTSAADEIYPMLSKDGKSMYFASKGLYGVGGYDLYVSRWDEDVADWSVPVNMGFPYSSPADDFLLAGSEDEKYTLFASDRGCPSDSVWVYVLEVDNMPVRSEMSDPRQLAELAEMKVSRGIDDGGKDVKSDIPENSDTRKYMERMALVLSLRDSIAVYENALAEYRERYAIVESEAEKNRIAEQILGKESVIPEFQASLDESMRILQEIEMDFLFSGVVIDPDKLLVEAEREVIGEGAEYVFAKMNMGEPLTLEMERPKPKFDYSFRVLDTARFAEETRIPEGIVYQIQIFTTGQPAAVKSLKGLCPVFETRSATGRYIYRVGLFSEYKDVLSRLNTVKKMGFRSAYIVGYVDGKEMPVNHVRNVEKERQTAAVEFYNVTVVPAGAVDDVMLEGIRQQASGKDIGRGDDGLVIGPFGNKSQAMALLEFIEVMGYGDATLVKIEN